MRHSCHSARDSAGATQHARGKALARLATHCLITVASACRANGSGRRPPHTRQTIYSLVANIY